MGVRVVRRVGGRSDRPSPDAQPLGRTLMPGFRRLVFEPLENRRLHHRANSCRDVLPPAAGRSLGSDLGHVVRGRFGGVDAQREPCRINYVGLVLPNQLTQKNCSPSGNSPATLSRPAHRTERRPLFRRVVDVTPPSLIVFLGGCSMSRPMRGSSNSSAPRLLRAAGRQPSE